MEFLPLIVGSLIASFFLYIIIANGGDEVVATRVRVAKNNADTLEAKVKAKNALKVADILESVDPDKFIEPADAVSALNKLSKRNKKDYFAKAE